MQKTLYKKKSKGMSFVICWEIQEGNSKESDTEYKTG